MSNPFRISLVGLASAAALLAGPASAVDQFLFFQNDKSAQSTLVGRTELTQYVDWSASSSAAGHNNYGTMDWTTSGGSLMTGVKFLNYTTYSGSNQPGRCFQINTKNLLPPGPTADPIILVKNSSGAWVKLADDVHDGSYAEAYIYFYGGSNTRSNPKIRIAAYHSGHNAEAFQFSSSWYTDDMNTCLEGISGTADYGTRASAYVDASGNLTIRRAR